MTGDLKCPACRVRSIEYPTYGGIVEDRSCTGRAGCVQHPERETPAPEKPPAGPDVPDGTTDIVERLRRFAERDSARRDVPIDPEQHICGLAADEIARLLAEVERLTGERDEARKAGGEARISENKAEHARVSMSLRVTKMEADRAALATRVAEAVREACAEKGHSLWYDAESEDGPSHTSDGIRAIDLAAVLAGVKTGEEG